MLRIGRTPLWLLVLTALLTTGSGEARLSPEPLRVIARPVPLNPADPGQRHIGELRFRGGVELTSPDPRFGGISGIRLKPDHRTFIMVSDAGYRIEGQLLLDAAGELEGVANATIQPLTDLAGEPLKSKALGDAEALLRTADGGIIVAFEGRHRLWRYSPGSGRARPLPLPSGIQNAPSNGGIEAITRLKDGRLLVLTEEYVTGEGTVGWLQEAQQWQPFALTSSEGFRPTDAAILPNGDLLVLERRFPPVGARLRRIAAKEIRSGAVLDGHEVGRFERPASVDNMEGVEVLPLARGQIGVLLVSDDNYNPFLQRTLLMLFEMAR